MEDVSWYLPLRFGRVAEVSPPAGFCGGGGGINNIFKKSHIWVAQSERGVVPRTMEAPALSVTMSIVIIVEITKQGNIEILYN